MITFNIDDVFTFYAATSAPSTGAAADVDSSGVPSYRIYEEETGTAILTGNMALLDDTNTTGLYSEQVTLSAANGFEDGKCYCARVAATVGGVAGHDILRFRVAVPSVNTTKWGGTAVASAVINSALQKIIGTTLTETSAGYLAAAFKKLFDVATPVLTAASVNQTGDNYGRLGAPAGASIAADIAANAILLAALPSQSDITGGGYPLDTDANGRIRIVDGTGVGEIDTLSGTVLLRSATESAISGIVTTLGANGAGLSAIPWNATWDAEVQSEVQDAIEANHLDHLLAVAYDPATKPGHASALWNTILENDAGVPRFTANALELAPTGGGGGSTDWTADERTAIRTILGIPATGTTPDAPTAGALKVIDDFLDTEIGTILSTLGTSGNGLTAVPWNASWVTPLLAALGLASGNLDTQFGSIPTQAEITGGAYPLDTDANGRIRIVDGTGVGEIDTLSGTVLLRSATQAQIDAIEVDTSTTLQAQITALNDLSAAEILTTQLTESYAANGVAPTLTQAVFAIHQCLMDFSVSGLTYQVKKLDSSTNAFAMTLDDASNPTGMERV